MANLAEKTHDLLRIQTEMLLHSTSHTHLQLTSPTLQEDEFNFVLSQCTDAELNEYSYSQPIKDCPTVVNEAPSGSCFRQPITDAELQVARMQVIPKNTVRNTTWSMNVWKEWMTYRRSVCSPLDCPPHLLLCTPQKLDYWLSKFILEVRKADRALYPPNSLHQIICGIQSYVRKHRPAVNFLKDAKFARVRRTLDSEMKCFRAKVHGVMSRRAKPLTVEEETQLWQSRLLGEHSPQVLLDTM